MAKLLECAFFIHLCYLHGFILNATDLLHSETDRDDDQWHLIEYEMKNEKKEA
jgi:hypothetical protein